MWHPSLSTGDIIIYKVDRESAVYRHVDLIDATKEASRKGKVTKAFCASKGMHTIKTRDLI